MGRSSFSVIVLAAGRGRRMGARNPKMLLRVAGEPLLYWTLRNLEDCSCVDSIVLAVTPGQKPVFERALKSHRFRKIAAVVEGGKERTDSTRRALRALPEDCGWVGIHDGARPFVSCAQVRDCLALARKSGAAILAVPGTDTVKLVRSGPSRIPVVRATLPRSRCWAAQTPQIFRRDIAERLHRTRRDENYTDDASIAETLGYKVLIARGSYENIKVTTPEDLPRAESILRNRKP